MVRNPSWLAPNRIWVARNSFCELPVFRTQFDGFMVESPSLPPLAVICQCNSWFFTSRQLHDTYHCTNVPGTPEKCIKRAVCRVKYDFLILMRNFRVFLILFAEKYRVGTRISLIMKTRKVNIFEKKKNLDVFVSELCFYVVFLNENIYLKNINFQFILIKSWVYYQVL